jgi:hypothetical protein
MELQLAASAIRLERAGRMNSGQTVNWRLRIGLALSLILGAAWGLLLGWMQIRVNMSNSPWLAFGIAMPAAFWGSMVVGLAFNRMLQGWERLARLLVALLIVAAGIPFGLLWGLLEQGLDPAKLANETGALMWDFEWMMAIAGLFGGMWPRWTVPFLRLFGLLARWILSGPTGIAQWIGQKTLNLLQPVAQFFAAVGRACLWAPTQIHRLITRTLQNVGTLSEQLQPPPIESAQPWRPRRATLRGTRSHKPKSTFAAVHNNCNHGDIARVTGVVEDRCPYCFDIVKRNDPRGVRVCEVCGTPHHADCWAIAGKCQIPHLNT